MSSNLDAAAAPRAVAGIAIALAVAAQLGSSQEIGYVLIDLGPVDPGDVTVGHALNRLGSVAGVSRPSNEGAGRPAMWRRGFVIDLVEGNPAARGEAVTVNRFGATAGYIEVSPGASPEAVIWDGPDMTILPLLPGGSGAEARGINSFGDAAGLTLGSRGALGQATLWLADEVLGLGTLGAGYSIAHDLNDRLQVVGFSLLPEDGQHAFIWSDGVMKDLGTLGGDLSHATSINNLGEVVGYSSLADGYVQAFRWRDGVMEGLGSLAKIDSYAYDINNRGQIVGYSFDDESRRSAFIYTDVSGMIDLNNLLLAPGGEWRLEAAYGINDAGQVTGFGQLNGESRGFMLSPLQPYLYEPIPGVAGQVNDIVVGGVTPGAAVDIYYGFAPGESAVRGCPGVSLDLQAAVLFRSSRGNEVGVARAPAFVSGRAAGRRILAQAIDRKNCRLSQVLTFTFE